MSVLIFAFSPGSIIISGNNKVCNKYLINEVMSCTWASAKVELNQTTEAIARNKIGVGIQLSATVGILSQRQRWPELM